MTNGAAPGLIAAVDIGGTFTDSVLVEPDGRVAYGKALSSPGDDFQGGFFGSLTSAAKLAGYDPDELFENLTRLVSHGSTVATNIVVENNGATVGLLTTKGHEDTLLMMRGLGRVVGEPPENILRVVDTSKPAPLVPRERIRGVTERVDSTGEILVALDEAGARGAGRASSPTPAARPTRSASCGRPRTPSTSSARGTSSSASRRTPSSASPLSSRARSASTSGRSPRSSTRSSGRAPPATCTSSRSASASSASRRG